MPRLLPIFILLLALFGTVFAASSPCIDGIEPEETFRGVCAPTSYRKVLEASYPTSLQGGKCLTETNAQCVSFKITTRQMNITDNWPSIVTTPSACFEFTIKDDLDANGEWQERAMVDFYDPTCTVKLFNTSAYWLLLRRAFGDYFNNKNQLCQTYIPGPLFYRPYDPVTSFDNAYFTTEFTAPENPVRPFEVNSELISLTAVWVTQVNQSFEAASLLFNQETQRLDTLSTIWINKKANCDGFYWPSSFPPPPPPPPSFAKRSKRDVEKKNPYYLYQGKGMTFKVDESLIDPAERWRIQHLRRTN